MAGRLTSWMRAVYGPGLVGVLALWLAGSGCYDGSRRLPPPSVRPVQTQVSRPTAPLAPLPPRPAVSAPAGWIPSAQLEQKGRWQGILVHHSATDSGSAAEFHRAHQGRVDGNGESWLGLGYHFVIDNGRGGPDGRIEVGFRWDEQLQGAHCRPVNCPDNYWNEHTIGICLVGNFEQERPTRAQYDSLAKLIRFLCDRYNIGKDQIAGHGDVRGANTRCPGRYFSWEELRRRL